MSIREVLIKSSELGYNKIALISEIKGNPSRIDFQDALGEIILSLDITVGIPNSNADSKSRVKSENLKLNSEVSELDQLGNILDIPKFTEGTPLENLMVIKRSDHKYRALVEFYGSNGIETGPKIFIKEWRY
ncbi:MAG TPA: ribosomal biogenesis protein [Methanobacterium sp.]